MPNHSGHVDLYDRKEVDGGQGPLYKWTEDFTQFHFLKTLWGGSAAQTQTFLTRFEKDSKLSWILNYLNLQQRQNKYQSGPCPHL